MSNLKGISLILLRNCLAILFGMAVLLGCYALSQCNYLLFHGLVEIFAVVIGCTVFILFWNTRRFMDNGFFLFIGIACLFACLFDLMHVLSYQKVSVFSEASGDVSIQLKSAGRLMASLSFLIAPLFLCRRINSIATLIAYSGFFAVVICFVFGDILPDFYIPGAGMTFSEHFCRGFSCVVFLIAGCLLAFRRKEMDAHVFKLLLASLIASSLSEFLSAISVNFFGFFKVGAHLSEVISFYLIYRTFIEVGCVKPYSLLFRNLKQSEEALQYQQKYLEAVFDSVKSGIVACDTNGILTFFNRAACEFHGKPQEFLPAEKWAEHYDLYLPDGKTRMKTEEIPLFRALRGEECKDVEMMIVPKNGESRTLLASGQPIIDEHGNNIGAVAAMHEITLRKRAENNLRKTEERFQSLLKYNNNGITLMDRQHCILMINEAQAKMFGKPVEAFIGRECYREFEKRESVCSHCPGSRAMDSGQPAEVETTGVLDNGKTFAARVQAFPVKGPDGQIDGFFEFVEDITQRKQIEDVLRESEQRHRLFAENVTDILWSMDFTGKFTYASSSVKQLLGYTPAEILQLTYTQVIAPSSIDLANNKFAELIVMAQTNQNVKTDYLELEFLCKDGSTFWGEMAINGFYDLSGEVVGFQGVTRNITKRKQMEEALRDSEQRYRTLLENAPDGFIFHDTRGNVYDVNRRICELLGYSREELIGQKIFVFEVGIDPVSVNRRLK
jgi:PAS domain S-box-containing protein